MPKSLKCIIWDCPGRNCEKIQLFRFPTKYPETFKVWCQNLKLSCEHVMTSSRVCSRHFDVSCFGRKMLKQGAVPTLLLGHDDDKVELPVLVTSRRRERKRRCSVPFCSTSTPQTIFSTREQNRYEWARVCGISEEKKLKTVLICRKHFNDDMVTQTSLKKHAYPCRNLPSQRTQEDCAPNTDAASDDEFSILFHDKKPEEFIYVTREDADVMPELANKTPEDADVKPDLGNGTPADVDAEPVLVNEIPADAVVKQEIVNKMPVDADKMPADSGKIPANGYKMPADADKMPEDTKKMTSNADKMLVENKVNNKNKACKNCEDYCRLASLYQLKCVSLQKELFQLKNELLRKQSKTYNVEKKVTAANPVCKLPTVSRVLKTRW